MNRLRSTGALMAICCLLTAASAFPSARVPVGALQVHWATLLAPLVLLVSLPTGARRIWPTIWFSALAFAAAFALVSLIEPGGLSQVLKVCASLVTFAAAATAIRDDRDVQLAAGALVMAAAIAGARGFAVSDGPTLAGINPLRGIGNKNAYSFYALPALLLGAHVVMTTRDRPRLRGVVGAGLVVISFALFSTANRSGWLGAAAIVVMMGARELRRPRRVMLLLGVVLVATVVVSQLGNQATIHRRVQQTRDGTRSDQLRLELVIGAFEVGASRPILGVSPQRVPYFIARRTGVLAMVADTHNVFATLWGGGGLVLVLGAALFGAALWSTPPGVCRRRHGLMRAMLALWCLRGAFSAEILFSPTFALGLGICAGHDTCRDSESAE